MSNPFANLIDQFRREAPARDAHVTIAKGTVAVASVDIPEALKNVPPHILATTPMEKLTLQTPHFECPAWAQAPPLSSTAHFEVHKDGERHSDLPINKYPYYILGLSQKLCDFKFEHPSISRLHCAVVHHKSGAVFVLDLNSANGVKVNGTRIAKAQPVQLNAGDQLQLGASSRLLTLRLTPSTRAPEKPSTAHPVVPIGAKRPLEQSEEANAAQVAPPQPSPSATAPPVASVEASPPTLVPPPTVTVAHLLLKHKDVENPVSKAPRNRNAPVTRSKEDALKMANALRERSFAVQPVSLAAFTAAVEQFSECATAKKGGQMPPIERGTFVDVFEDAAFALEPMHVSLPVETSLGIHLILRLPAADEGAHATTA